MSSFNANDWLHNFRLMMRSDEVRTTGAASKEIQPLISAFVAVHSRHIAESKPNTLHQSVVSAFVTKLELLARFSSRTRTPTPILHLDEKQQRQVVDTLFNDFIGLVAAIGIKEKSLKTTPVLYMSPSEFTAFKNGYPSLTPSEHQLISCNNPKDPQDVANKMLTTATVLRRRLPELSFSESKRFALRNPNDALQAAETALENGKMLCNIYSFLTPSEGKLLAFKNPRNLLAAADDVRTAILTIGRRIPSFSVADAKHFAFHNPKAPVAAAERARDAIEEIRKAAPGVPGSDIKYVVLHTPKAPMAALVQARKSADELVRLRPTLRPAQAMTIALRGPKDPKGALENAVANAARLMTKFAIDEDFALDMAISNSKDPVAATKRVLDAITELKTKQPGLSDSEAKRIAIGYRDAMGALEDASRTADVIQSSTGVSERSARRRGLNSPRLGLRHDIGF